MARSTTGTSKVYSCETISNHKALRAFGEDPRSHYVAAQLCRERDFPTYDSAAYRQLAHPYQLHLLLCSSAI